MVTAAHEHDTVRQALQLEEGLVVDEVFFAWYSKVHWLCARSDQDVAGLTSLSLIASVFGPTNRARP